MPDLERSTCADCVEAHRAAAGAPRRSALRNAAIRAYQAKPTAFAIRFAKEALPGWDE